MRKNKLITEGQYADLALAFYLSKKLVTKFENWSAFDLGIIDKKGKILKKRLTTKEERNAFTILDKLILKVRTIVGDNLFVKIGTVALLMADHKPKGKMIVEQFPNEETKLFRKIQEQILDNHSQITIPLTTSNEEIRIDYEINELKDKFNFLLGVFLDDDLVAGLGGNYLPNNDINQNFLSHMNNIINNLDKGDNTILHIQDDQLNDVSVNINYNSNEIKIQKVNDEKSIQSSVIADFFIIFEKDKEKQDFIKGWNKFYKKLEWNNI